MYNFLVDTDILIDHLRKDERAIRFLESAVDEDAKIFYSVITKVEIYAGVREEEKEITARLFESLNYINFDDDMALIAGVYLNKFARAYSLEIGDAVIAATAKTMNLPIVTRNKKHYPMKDVKVIVPY